MAQTGRSVQLPQHMLESLDTIHRSFEAILLRDDDDMQDAKCELCIDFVCS